MIIRKQKHIVDTQKKRIKEENHQIRTRREEERNKKPTKQLENKKIAMIIFLLIITYI